MSGSNRVVIGILALSVVVASVSAHADEYWSRQDSITTGLGNASAYNMAVHTIDPWPASSRNPRVHMDGERALLAAERYKANRTVPPRGLTTQSINVQGSSPGGGIAPR